MRTTFEFILTPEHFSKALTRNNQRMIHALSLRWLVQITSLVISATFIFLFAYALNGSLGSYSTVLRPVLVLLVVGGAAVLLNIFLKRRGFIRLAQTKNHLVGVPCQLTIEDAGLLHRSPNWESLTRWSGFVGITEAEGVVLLLVDNAYFYPLPASTFASNEEKEAFVAYVRDKIAAASREYPSQSMVFAPRATSIETTPLVIETGNRKSESGILLKNLINAFKLAFFCPIAEDRISVDWWQVAVFGFASLLIPVIYDTALIGLHGEFEWDAIPSAMAHLPIILFAAIVVAYALGRSEKTLLLLQMFLMITVGIDLVVYITTLVAALLYPQFWTRLLSSVYYILLPPLWLAAACATTVTGLFSVASARRKIASAVCTVLLAVPLTWMVRDRSLWHEARQGQQSAEAGANEELLGEDLFYNQAKLLERELAAVRPGRRGTIDVYFIGVGGDAEQDVFMKEVDAVSRLFRERFGAEGKIIKLVNNRKSAATSPIASVTSLRASLKRVSEVMDKDEDILFLFLTSHGAQTHRLSLDFWPLQLYELYPAKLRALLDESGIKNRVVVVSACYSGGFIDALRNENSLVISASAPDKNSFGCSQEADWTYFGKAYFDEALRKTHSFVEAFELAKPVIAEREKTKGYEPSNPQIALGQDIKPKLLLLQRQLTAP